ncbi:MAG: hypothetical protein PVJ60_00035 [Phycisphaerales bacterium]
MTAAVEKLSADSRTAAAVDRTESAAAAVDKPEPAAVDRAETSEAAADRAANTSAVAAPEAVNLASFGRGSACPIPLEQPV